MATGPTTGRQGGGATRRGESNIPPEAWFMLIFVGFILAVIGLHTWDSGYKEELNKPPEYSVAIAGVSGLPTSMATAGNVLINPEFNLTIAVASQSKLAGACILPGTSIKVSYSYGRLPLASGRAPDICVGPLQSSEKRVVARGVGVAVPGFLINSLVEDVERGEAVFEVTMKTLVNKHWKVVTCWPRLVPDKTPCIMQWNYIGNMPDPEPAGAAYVGQLAVPQCDAPVAGSCPATKH